MATFEEAFGQYSAGRPVEARRLLEARLAAAPQDARCQFLLGLVEIDEGAAGAGLNRIEQRAPDYLPPAAICLRFGELRFAQRDFARAEAWLRRALAQDPSSSQAWTTLGNVLRMLGNVAGAERAFRRGIELAPGREDGYVGLAFLLQALDRSSEAAGVMTALAQAAAGRREVLEKALAFLEDLGRLETAAGIGGQLLELVPGDARLQTRIGRLLAKLGKFEAAAECYRRAIALDPASDAAYLGLAVVRRFDSPEHPDAALIRAALAAGGLGDSAAICANFALGKILDDCGEYGAAFRHVQLANDAHRRSRPFEPAAYLARTRRLRETFSTAALGELPACPPANPTPVFVVGMMRSGTTLVERILDSHPQVYGAGELHLVESMAATLGLAATGGAATGTVTLEPGRLRALARGYLEALERLSRGAQLVVDKNPGNFAYIGLLSLLFPNAKFVHCTRDPLDTCLSIYFQHFAYEAHAWTYDLGWIGEVYADYRETMAHWQAVLPGALFEVDYAALVRDPEAVTRALLDFLGLPFDAACLESHRNERPVGTASVWQARQRVYTESLGRSRHYREQLAPLRRQLRAAGVALAED
jgi:tetratricopeptide (TPR) repeat protein